MRRLVLLVSSLVLVDTMLYAVLTPLLPRFAERYDLSKAGAGALVAAYAAGALLGGLPGGIASARVGPRAAVLVGLALMAAASVGFALAASAWALGAARLLQGFGSAFTWSGALTWLVTATPRHRRGELLGAALGAAVFGALLGPVLGATAAFVGTTTVFSGVAVLGGLLAVAAARTATVAPELQPVRALGPALRDGGLRSGLWLMVLPSLLFGVLGVLAPLALDRAGWGAAAIGATFLVAAGVEMLLAPVWGRISDRRGRLYPLRIALASAVAVTAVLAAAQGLFVAGLVVAAALAYGAFWAPALALISDGAERSGLAHGLAFGAMNAAWAIGNVVGPAAGGALAGRLGDAVPYLVAAGICAATLAVLRPRGPSPALET